nr:unnamed protein product [Callosobruchus chinensis]
MTILQSCCCWRSVRKGSFACGIYTALLCLPFVHEETRESAGRQLKLRNTSSSIVLSCAERSSYLAVDQEEGRQQEWNRSTKKLNVKPSVTTWTLPPDLSRRKQCVIARLRIGHTFLTHSFLLLRNPPPQCESRQTSLTRTHLILDCTVYAHPRQVHNIPQNLQLSYQYRFHA